MYMAENAYHFMDTTTYEQIYLDGQHMGDAANYMIENVITSYSIHYTKLYEPSWRMAPTRRRKRLTENPGMGR